jgi:ADP-dependent NAD(P)H-hydrate dehydratase / NAD(P)H-hydrate epimerase
MKILSASQIYQADAMTLKTQSISSLDLMERVGEYCFKWIDTYFNKEKVPDFYIFCGVGNNGGDGLVIARHLALSGYNVKTFIVNFSKNRSDDFIENLERFKNLGLWPIFINTTDKFPKIPIKAVIIDAIFGLGLKRPPEGFVKKLIQYLNAKPNFILAIDLPSGVYASAAIEDKDAVIKASHTLTFQNLKLAFILPENQEYISSWKVLDIGLDKDFIKALESPYHIILEEDVGLFYKRRKTFSHKGTYGHALIIGGSYGKIGAVVLASAAANAIGSGLVSSLIPICGYQIVQTLVPETMVLTSGEKNIANFKNDVKATVIGVGPGMGTDEVTQKAFVEFLKTNKCPLVIDADAINCLALNKSALSFIPKNSILTPHPKELERLIGTWQNDYEKLEMLREFSIKYNLIIVLKGAYTVIVNRTNFYFNSTGNPALATGGSGDALTGIITGLLAQQYTAIEAAKLGVFLHGSTADLAIEDNIPEACFSASDIIDYLPRAINKIKSIKKDA